MTRPDFTPPVAPGDVEQVDVQRAGALTAELRHTQRTTGVLLRLIQRSSLPQDTTTIEALDMFVEAEIPKAQALARAALMGAIPAEGIMIMWRRAKQAFHAAAPAVMDMYFEKMERGAACPYSERLLVEAMKGMGLTVPGEPISEAERGTQISNEEIQSMTNEQLMEQLRQGAGFSDSEED